MLRELRRFGSTVTTSQPVRGELASGGQREAAHLPGIKWDRERLQPSSLSLPLSLSLSLSHPCSLVSVVLRPVPREYLPVLISLSCTHNGAKTCRSCRTEVRSIPEDLVVQVRVMHLLNLKDREGLGGRPDRSSSSLTTDTCQIGVYLISSLFLVLTPTLLTLHYLCCMTRDKKMFRKTWLNSCCPIFLEGGGLVIMAIWIQSQHNYETVY